MAASSRGAEVTVQRPSARSVRLAADHLRPQVLSHHDRHQAPLAVGEGQPLHNSLGHDRPRLGVAEKPDAAIGLDGLAGRLCYVVQQGGEAEGIAPRSAAADGLVGVGGVPLTPGNRGLGTGNQRLDVEDALDFAHGLQRMFEHVPVVLLGLACAARRFELGNDLR